MKIVEPYKAVESCACVSPHCVRKSRRRRVFSNRGKPVDRDATSHVLESNQISTRTRNLRFDCLHCFVGAPQYKFVYAPSIHAPVVAPRGSSAPDDGDFLAALCARPRRRSFFVLLIPAPDRCVDRPARWRQSFFVAGRLLDGS